MKSFSRVRPSATPWTAAFQALPSMGFSRQEYWSGVPLPSPKTITRNFQHREPDFYAFVRRRQFIVNRGRGYTKMAGVSYLFKTDCRWFGSKSLMILDNFQTLSYLFPLVTHIHIRTENQAVSQVKRLVQRDVKCYRIATGNSLMPSLEDFPVSQRKNFFVFTNPLYPGKS